MSQKAKEMRKGAAGSDVYSPVMGLRDEIDRLFDDFSLGWPFASVRRPGGFGLLRSRAGEAAPDVDVIDRDRFFEIRAELPGVDEKDIDLRIMDDAVLLKAEKREEHTEGEEGSSYYLSECRYGSLHRMIPLPPGVDTTEVDATFRKGVLHVKLPRRPDHDGGARKVEIQTS